LIVDGRGSVGLACIGISSNGSGTPSIAVCSTPSVVQHDLDKGNDEVQLLEQSDSCSSSWNLS
jgi:hypothetical protein